MCRYNIHCQEVACLCHKRPSAFQLIPSKTPLPPPPLQSNTPVLQLIQHQTELIKTISQQTADFMAILAQMSTKLDFFAATPASRGVEVQISKPHSGSDELSTAEDVERLLAPSPCSYTLRVVSEIPRPVFKERAFALTCEVLDAAGHRATDVSFTCKLRLFSYDKPLRMLKTNTSGDKVMHGSIEAEVSQGLCVFPNIVIKEVTSHFKNGVFFLAVAGDHCEVRPLVIENLVVKARRVSAAAKPRKRPRAEPSGAG